MTDFKKIFFEEIELRNQEQQRAINAIEGPVMVIAGPGTGKTDVLGLRIGNILQQTQTAIQHILCLTFTEAGAMEMRRRLHKYIGPEAYNAQIFTFHGFCNMVIHENLEKFGMYRDSQPVSDLEQFQILRQIIDEQPLDHPLKRLTGKVYYETRRLRNLFDVMKMERWSPEKMREDIRRWIEEQQESDKYIYKRRSTKAGKTYEQGDLKDWLFDKEVTQPMKILTAAVNLFDTYNTRLREAGRYDYHDMLTWVHDAFKSDHNMLASYQERYLYFHVDEFQDTNGIQLAILNLLASHWPRPDVFIVGDDDQSIFRFQGANMHNITAFKEKYDPEVIILTDNYRSSQHILDAASAVIAHNEERLVAQYPEYSKNLKACGPAADFNRLPEIRVYPNWTQEQAALLAELSRLHETGILEREVVAVIYRMHKQVEDLVHILEVRDIPLSVKKPVNILERPLIRNILTMLTYLAHEIEKAHSGQYLLYEIMQFPYFSIPHTESGKIALAAGSGGKRDRTPWRDITSSTDFLQHIGVDAIDEVAHLDSLIATWIGEYHQLTIQELLEQILTKAGIFQWIFDHPNRAWHLQIVKTFMDFIKKECMRSPGLRLARLLENLSLMKENGIELPVHKILNAPHGIHFVTAHAAKGMQFDRVYMIGCTKDIWDETGRGDSNKYILPDLVPSNSEENDEDERRLFYVGMTRAKTHLTMSYALQDDNEREREASRFIGEVIDSGIVTERHKELTEEGFVTFCRDLFTPLEVETPIVDPALLRETLEDFTLSASALNKYLECPRKFYFENILRIPSAEKPYFGFGKAVHGALEQLFMWSVAEGSFTRSPVHLVDFYDRQLRKYRSHFTDSEFERYQHHGREILDSYIQQRIESWKKPDKTHPEYSVRDTEHRGIPIKGFVDRVDEYSDYLEVVDYKTGKYRNARSRKHLFTPGEKCPAGGDYWRQIIFYRILLDAENKFNKKVQTGFIDFVSPRSNGVHELVKIVISDDDVAFVSDQMQEVYERIRSAEFHEGCRQPDCYWCQLVENNLKIEQGMEMPHQEEVI